MARSVLGCYPDTLLERRMVVHQIKRIDEYINYLKKNPCEVKTLLSDLLIGVTSFFCDHEPFRILIRKIIPKLFANRSAGQQQWPFYHGQSDCQPDDYRSLNVNRVASLAGYSGGSGTI
jgi:hypothetical protein